MASTAGDPRNLAAWKRLRRAVLATSDTCWLCGRPGADTVDHVTQLADGGLPFDTANLRPAHGRKIPGVCPGNYGRRNTHPATLTNRTRNW